MESHQPVTPPAMVFVGTIIPDEPRFHGPAFNRAAQMFQENLVDGLRQAGFPTEIVISLEPMPAFPRGRRLFVRGGTFASRTGQSVRLLPFVNFHPFKWLSAGIAVLAELVRWSWRHRRESRIIHCVNLTMPPGLFIWLAARLTRSQTLVSVLDVFRPGALVPDTLYGRVDFALQRWLLPRYDGHMVVADAIAEDFVPGRPVCRIEGGVVPNAFDAVAKPAREDVPGPFRVVLSGSLELYNGVDLAIAAAARLPEGFELLIAGSGTQAERVRERVAGSSRIRYLGFLDFGEVLELYRSADLLLNARLTHTMDTRYFFPSKLMELLASGTPVLSTCTGHVEQEYGPVLYLLRDETPEALAGRILDIAARPLQERQALGHRAREFMFTEKTWKKQGENLARYIRTEILRSR
jgi:glycosyltransferase involved in cell wall biosynthesis